jgi:putative hemolysin
MMKTKTTTLSLLLINFLILPFAFAQTEEAKPMAQPNFPPVPKLNKGEYAVFVEKAYIVFKTKEANELEFDISCFKNGKTPACEAATAANNTTPPKYKRENLFHPAALFCEARGGRNLIAIDHKKDEFNFCRFKDNSMVNSWAMYLKHNPKKIIK